MMRIKGWINDGCIYGCMFGWMGWRYSPFLFENKYNSNFEITIVFMQDQNDFEMRDARTIRKKVNLPENPMILNPININRHIQLLNTHSIY